MKACDLNACDLGACAMKATKLALLALLALGGRAIAGPAEDALHAIDAHRGKGYSVVSVTPIFSQLVSLGTPRGFVAVFEKPTAVSYIREAVPQGETVDDWTQMITVSGYKDAATEPNLTPKAFLGTIAAGFQQACPSSYGAKILSEAKISGFDAIVAVLSCGVSPTTAGKTSESALIAVIKGQADVYTIQWAEHGALSRSPIQVDEAKWQGRFNALAPIKLCPIVAGETAPYPSCVGGQKPPV